MPPAVILAGAAVAGSAISASASNKATKAAKKAAADNNALAREQYGLNSANLSPYISRGNQAGGLISGLLGTGDKAASDAAYSTFRNASGYQNILNEGLASVNSNAYARGMGNSGATLKALQDRGSSIADSSLNNYIGQLRGTEGTGLAAANGLAGVGTNLVNQVSSNNNSAATATGNAALYNASQQNSLIQNLLNAGASAYGSSYRSGNNAYGISGSDGIY